jgi:hypothetical protein
VTESGFPGSLERQAHRLGRLVRVEEQVVEVLGVQLARADDGAVVVALADRIRRHRQAASIVRDRLPVLREFPVDRLVDDGSMPEWDAALGALLEAPRRSGRGPGCRRSCRPATGRVPDRRRPDAGTVGPELNRSISTPRVVNLTLNA